MNHFYTIGALKIESVASVRSRANLAAKQLADTGTKFIVVIIDSKGILKSEPFADMQSATGRYGALADDHLAGVEYQFVAYYDVNDSLVWPSPIYEFGSRILTIPVSASAPKEKSSLLGWAIAGGSLLGILGLVTRKGK